MPTVKSRVNFISTEKGQEIRNKFLLMAADATYYTASSYSANKLLYSDNLIPFVDKHMNYLVSHPMLDPDKYLANVKLVTRIR